MILIYEKEVSVKVSIFIAPKIIFTGKYEDWNTESVPF